MDKYIFDIKIIDKIDDYFIFQIQHHSDSTILKYNPTDKTLAFSENDFISSILQENEYQIQKIFHNKRIETFYIGFSLKIVVKNNEKSIEFNDKSKIIVLDKRNKTFTTFAIEDSEENLHTLYTDGCFLEKEKKGGIVALIKTPENEYYLYKASSNQKSSSLLELIAVLKGLEKLNAFQKIRIVTDSRYVIKGLTEWIENWKLNNWHTAQGKKVKNITYWKKFDKLTKNKYIEFQWVKAHSFHYENTLCDYFAKLSAKGIQTENNTFVKINPKDTNLQKKQFDL